MWNVISDTFSIKFIYGGIHNQLWNNRLSNVSAWEKMEHVITRITRMPEFWAPAASW